MTTNFETATELELREAEAPWPNSEKELVEFVRVLVGRGHDYATCVYAVSLAAVAAFNYVASQLGVTGFQASCADLDILRRTRGLEHGFRILDYSNLLYPQCLGNFETLEEIMEEQKEELAKAAADLLADGESAHPAVRKHWEMLVERGSR